MSTFKLNPEALAVTSFDTSVATRESSFAALPGEGGYCCTGCDSGCGIFPTECYCESQSESGTGMCLPATEIE
jgi:hypothetical protein